MTSSPTEPCSFCGGPEGIVSWRRTLPDLIRAHACLICHTTLVKTADQVGGSWEDGPRLSRQAAALGGEVWNAGGIDHWFREPVALRSFDRAEYHARLPRSP